jgi:hypothetical protein
MSNPQSGSFVEFFMESVELRYESEKAGRPIFKEMPFIRIQHPGDRLNILEVKADDHYKQKYNRQWREFEAGLAGEVIGTPLSQWPQVTKSQCKEAEYFGIRTVENLAEVNDAALQRIGIGWMELRKKARDYLAAAAGNAPISALQAENEKLKQEFEALKASLQNPEIKRKRQIKEEVEE